MMRNKGFRFPEQMLFEKGKKLEILNDPNENVFASKSAAPLVFSGIAKKWLAWSIWDLDYLEKKIGHEYIIISNGCGPNKRNFSSNVKFLINKIRKGNDQVYYSNFSCHISTDMVGHYESPRFFDCWYKRQPKEDQKLVLSWIYMGTKGSYSPLHIDVHSTSAWNSLFVGKKLWLFFPPENTDLLNEEKNELFFLDEKKISIFDQLTTFIHVQVPGEIVYTPSGWWHCVLNLESGFALTENFINELNYYKVRNDLNKSGYLKAAIKLDSLKYAYQGRT